MMSELVIVAIVGAVPATIAALGSLVNGRKLNVVHEMVNGGWAAAKEEIVKLKLEIATLQSELVDLRALKADMQALRAEMAAIEPT